MKRELNFILVLNGVFQCKNSLSFFYNQISVALGKNIRLQYFFYVTSHSHRDDIFFCIFYDSLAYWLLVPIKAKRIFILKHKNFTIQSYID